MSQQMNEAKETVEKIIQQIESGSNPSKERLLVQLRNIVKLVSQNQGKIWLRTRSGKPMAEKIQAAAADALNQIGNASEIAVAIDMLEGVAKEIDEESQRRSMVVT
jgi:hypothetical protein